MVWSQQLHVHVLPILVGMRDQIIAVGVMEKSPYHLHSVLCAICVGFHCTCMLFPSLFGWDLFGASVPCTIPFPFV